MGFTVQNGKIQVNSKGFNDIINLTDEAVLFVRNNKFIEGQLLLFINGSTAAISAVEYEPGLLKDLPEMLEKIAPMGARYHHNDTWHDGNGYAHIRSTLIGPSLTVPVIDGRLVLGTWQQIILMDFDNSPRRREVILQFVGEKEI